MSGDVGKKNVTSASPQAVFLEHESWLRTVVRSRLNEPDAVEDVMQNIAMAIVKHRSMLDEVHRIGAWLYQIAVRQVLMHRRSSGRRRRMQDRLSADPSRRKRSRHWGSRAPTLPSWAVAETKRQSRRLACCP